MTDPHPTLRGADPHTRTLALLLATLVLGLLWSVLAVREERGPTPAECARLLERAQESGEWQDYSRAEQRCGTVY